MFTFWYQQHFRNHGDELCLRSSVAGSSVFVEEIHLGFHPSPAEIHGSLVLAPSKVWPGHLSAREGGILGPWEWQQRVAPGCHCSPGSLKAGLGWECAWTQLSWYSELRDSFLFLDSKVSSFSSVPSIAQGGRWYLAGGGFGVQGEGLRSDRCWGCSSHGFWSSWLGVLDSSQPWFLT